MKSTKQNRTKEVRYTKNKVYVHSDQKLMPESKKAWSSWNYIEDKKNKSGVNVTYWMNKLQSISNHFPLFVTLNPFSDFPIKEPHRHFTYLHPIFDQNAIEAQKKLNTILF